MTHINYNGSAPALTDVIAGRVPLMFDIWHSARRYVDSGELKLIAGAGPDPLPGAENVPVIDKTYPGFTVVAFNAADRARRQRRRRCWRSSPPTSARW